MITLPFVGVLSRPIRLPDGFLAIDREELMSLLRDVIARGEELGYQDDDYREWLASLVEEDE